MIFIYALALSLSLGGQVGLAQSGLDHPAGLMDYRGTMDGEPMGLTLVFADGKLHGNYFLKHDLVDVPFTANLIADGRLVGHADSGATFDLRFANPPGHGDASASGPLNFDNSTLLTGTWFTPAAGSTAAASRYVTFNLDSWHAGSIEGHRYIFTSDDGAVEKNAQAFYNAVLAGNAKAAAEHVSYPITVNLAGKKRLLHTQAEFLQDYALLFPPEYIQCLQPLMAHRMFANDRGAMLGAGEIWFDDRGAISINPCTRQAGNIHPVAGSRPTGDLVRH